MAVEGTAVTGGHHPQSGSGVMDKGLKKGAISYVSNIVIGVASTAPAYSLAATLGFIVAVSGTGLHAPGVLIASFVPILLVSVAYKYLNRADPDAGTTFAWTTRAFGPGMGWMNGWAIFLADILVMASLSDIAAIYSLQLFGIEETKALVLIIAVAWIVLMTWICWRGIELSAAIQRALLSFEVLMLVVFSIVALTKVYGGSAGPTAIKPTADWFNPFAINFGNLLPGVLLGVFIYWGWDSGVAVNEESEDPANGPGKAAVISTFLLVVIYLLVSTAAQAFHGTGFLSNEANAEDVLNALGKPVFGGGAIGWILAKGLIICVLTSASASTQTTILPTARTTLSMAHWKAVHKVLGKVHKTFLTPDVSTIGMGAISIIVTVPLLLVSESILADSITALGFPVCFYYGFTGLACPWYFRHELTKSARNFLLVGVAPLVGGLMLFGVFYKAVEYYGHKENVGSSPLLGITLPLWFGIGGLILGFILMMASRPYFKEFFARKTETAVPGVLEAPPVEAIPAAVDF
ncbi:MAG TPA: APC family permease [Solirubrobacteraceae bacterium]|nr:APC family permease [Solirubrobacteraceae bacterium]